MCDFNLQEALSGKPVVLRNGEKAFVLARFPNDVRKVYPLIGYTEVGNNEVSWTLDGAFKNKYGPRAYDIVGMWNDVLGLKQDDVVIIDDYSRYHVSHITAEGHLHVYQSGRSSRTSNGFTDRFHVNNHNIKLSED